MAPRIQLCGRLAVEIDGRRVEQTFPGRQGRLLFVYLCAHRFREVGRDELVEALWPVHAPAAADTALSALLSKLRRIVPVEGRSAVRLGLPPDAWIDLEAASEGVHRAETAVARGEWADAWAPARIALHTANRGFLAGESAPWVDEVRRRLDDLRVRALECAAKAGLGIGGAELDGALRSARRLVELAPYRESGYCLLMQALAIEGNVAEALGVYERLRLRLRDDVGAVPSPQAQALHRQLLG